jgi:hypothetical protein
MNDVVVLSRPNEASSASVAMSEHTHANHDLKGSFIIDHVQ